MASPSLQKNFSNISEKEEINQNKIKPGSPFPSIKSNSVEDIRGLLKKQSSQNVDVDNEAKFFFKEIKEKLLKKPAEYITLKGAYFGEITISSKYLIFISHPNKKRPDEHPYKFGALVNFVFEI